RAAPRDDTCSIDESLARPRSTNDASRRDRARRVAEVESVTATSALYATVVDGFGRISKTAVSTPPARTIQSPETPHVSPKPSARAESSSIGLVRINSV